MFFHRDSGLPVREGDTVSRVRPNKKGNTPSGRFMHPIDDCQVMINFGGNCRPTSATLYGLIWSKSHG